MRWLSFIIFISIFAGICLGGYYYILARLFSFFKLKQNLYFWLLLIVLAFGYIFFSILERRIPCGFFVFLLRISAIGLGVGWLCLVTLLSHDLLYLIFRFPISISRWAVIATVVSLSLYSFINTLRLEIKSVNLSAPVNMKIVQLSDIHRGSVSRRHLRRLIRKTNELKPDVVLITGDLLDPAGDLSPKSLEPLNELQHPAYWITGNHERYAGLNTVMTLLESTSIIPLRNKVVKRNGIQLIGIDDSEDRNHVARILPVLDFDPDLFTILMYHQPEGYNTASEAGVNLMLSGHTHNGQIWPFHWVVRSRFQYLRGLHHIGDMALYISTGSGTWGPPMRLGSRNQITVIHLQKNN